MKAAYLIDRWKRKVMSAHGPIGSTIPAMAYHAISHHGDACVILAREQMRVYVQSLQ